MKLSSDEFVVEVGGGDPPKLMLTSEAEALARIEEVNKLHILENDVAQALESVGLTTAQMVTLLAERRKIIYARSLILGLIKPEGHGE